MPNEGNRPPPQEPLIDLIELRRRKYPDMFAGEFARKFLGVTPAHMHSIEAGRRRPSIELAIRWLAALGPSAHLSMFGQAPAVEQIRAAHQLRHVA